MEFLKFEWKFFTYERYNTRNVINDKFDIEDIRNSEILEHEEIHTLIISLVSL